ncbi:hypothetical protein [Ferviditalea candida]|uniref:Uncharacterized protein n=1 Tax=Ferviditalea candida TaxID=3108399 RepID=A0ABU5ZMN2_9BACL|nr:hypothetical protein [Paenibacillaceae bacterium T2]
MFASQRDEFKELLQPVKRRLLLRQLISGIGRWSLWAMGAGILLLLAARFFPIPHYWSLAVGLLASAIGGWMIYSLLRPPAWEAAAREADRLGLSERAVTAWENRENAAPIAVMQREDTLRRLRLQLPGILQRLPVWTFARRPFMLHASAAGIWLLLLVLPNSMDAVLRERALAAQAVESAGQKLAEAVEEAGKNDKLTAEQKRQLRGILNGLKQELAENKPLAEQLNALEKAEMELLALRQKELQKREALRQLQQKLGENKVFEDAAKELAKQDRETLLEAMREIEKLMAGLSVQQQEELARLLEELAQTAAGAEGGDAGLQQIAENLHQAAENLRSVNLPQSFQEMKDALLQVMQQNAQMQDMAFQTARALNALQQSQMSLGQAFVGNSGQSGTAGQGVSGASGAASSGQGSPGGESASGQGSGSGGGQGQGAGQGAGSGSSSKGQGGEGQGSGQGQGAGGGQGQGSGLGSGQGQGAGQGAGSGSGTGGTGTGGTDTGGTGSGAGLGGGSHELVNVPSERIAGDGPTDTAGGPLGEGASETRQSSQTQVSSGTARPYEEVFQQYRQFARDSMERQLIPAEYQEVVKEYFTNIEP